MKDVYNFYIALKCEETFEPVDGCPLFEKADTIRRWMDMHKPEYTENCSVTRYGTTKNLITVVDKTVPYYIGVVSVNNKDKYTDRLYYEYFADSNTTYVYNSPLTHSSQATKVATLFNTDYNEARSMYRSEWMPRKDWLWNPTDEVWDSF